MNHFSNTPDRPFPYRIRTLSALVCLVLGGCAAPNVSAPDTGPSQLVVHTSTGQGWRREPPPSTRPVPVYDATGPRPVGAGAGASSTAPESPAAPRRSSGPSTMLNFVDADLKGVVRALARFTGRNFVVDPRVAGQLTLVSEVPVDAETAYSMLLGALRMQGFAVVNVNGVNRVVPEADAKTQGMAVSDGSQPNSGELITRVFPLRYENAANMLPMLRPMITPNNVINAYPGNNTLVVTDYADNVQRIARVIAEVDTSDAMSTDVIQVRYGVALDVAALAAQLLDERAGGGGTHQTVVVADPRSNSVLLRANSPEKLALARNLIRQIDNPNAQSSNLHVVYLRNAQAVHLAQVLRGALSGLERSSQGSAGIGAGDLSGIAGDTPGDVSGEFSTPASLLGGMRQSAPLPAGGAGAPFTAQTNANQPVAFSAGGATIQADPATNTLLISAPGPLYRNLREVIDQLDQRRAQVLVESLIVEVNADNASEFGIQWMLGGNDVSSGNAAFFGGANLGGTGLSANELSTIDSLGQGLSLGVVKGTVNILGNELINLQVLARAMESRGGANVLSTPNLMTLDNEEASIIVGRTVPFVTGQYTTSADGASNPFQTITREDVGLTLRIRPQISEGGTVRLSIYQEVSSLDPNVSLSTTQLVTRKRALDTDVLVDDGQIIVLGGLLEDRISDTTQSVPLLGDIPGIGNLFRYDSRSRSKTNLMVFLRPHIVRNARDSASVTLDRYNYMRSQQSGLPPRSNWLTKDPGITQLPAFEQNPATGLLDLRAPGGEAAPAPKESL